MNSDYHFFAERDEYNPYACDVQVESSEYDYHNVHVPIKVLVRGFELEQSQI